MHSPFPQIVTPRLVLRQILPQDVDALYAIHSDRNWMQWYGVEPITERYEALQLAEMFVSWHAAGSGFRWGLERRDDGRLIGTCGLFRWNKSWCNCVIGYEIAPDCSGQGLMLEAVQAILDYGFNDMGLHRVQAETHPDNFPSIKLAERLGFRFEGVHREQACWGGRFHDLNCYSLLRNEWLARSAP
ncbi:GNAT family N-acetyltransferase [Noviherbaspirillum sp.]|uniref:GNAT family N-acetyltransferase n=1 Tax=Noviherbaspirillum sp. TaxID=1926288 RepID=UPI002FE2C8AE